MKKFFSVALAIGCLLIVFNFFSMPTSASSSPNIVVIMIDDLDTASFNQLLNAGKLPEIKDNLVEKGTSFSDAFVSNSLCCPSRATFFTGQYAHNHSVQHVFSNSVNGGYDAFHVNGPNRPTLAIWLDNQGYYTALAGKYMNGYYMKGYINGTAIGKLIPGGWDFWRGISITDAEDHRYHLKAGSYTVVRDDGTPYGAINKPDVYQTKQIGEIGKHVLDNAQAPFFLYLAPTAPHVEDLAPGGYDPSNPNACNSTHPYYIPLESGGFLSPDDGDKGYSIGDYSLYNCVSGYPHMCLREQNGSPSPGFGLPGENLSSFNSFAGTPEFVADKWNGVSCGTNTTRLKQLHSERLESMLSIDVMVGKLFDNLESNGTINNTLVIFTSDNGFMLGEHNLGNKGVHYDESTSVPLIIRYPGQLTKISVDELVVNIDLAPTILDYAGLNWESTSYNVDGRSLRPLLEQQSNISWRQWFLIEGEHPRSSTNQLTNFDKWYLYPDYTGIRTTSHANNDGWENLLYVNYSDALWPGGGYSEELLYDMKTDPIQTTNIITTNTQVVAQMQWLTSILGNCSGASCRATDQLHGELLTDVTAYANGPCVGTGTPCKFDTRSYSTHNGQPLESITADGKYWNFQNGVPIWGSGYLYTVLKYGSSQQVNGITYQGPCEGKGQSCEFDTRSHFTYNGQPLESITAYGKYWNFQNGTLLWGSDYLSAVPKYVFSQQIGGITYQGPCVGKGQSCKFDTRSHSTYNGQTVESITAYGQYWNYVNSSVWPSTDTGMGNLVDVPRYALGPCQYTPHNKVCTFDSRSHEVDSQGNIIESITAYGRFWDFINGVPQS